MAEEQAHKRAVFLFPKHCLLDLDARKNRLERKIQEKIDTKEHTLESITSYQDMYHRGMSDREIMDSMKDI